MQWYHYLNPSVEVEVGLLDWILQRNPGTMKKSTFEENIWNIIFQAHALENHLWLNTVLKIVIASILNNWNKYGNQSDVEDCVLYGSDCILLCAEVSKILQMQLIYKICGMFQWLRIFINKPRVKCSKRYTANICKRCSFSIYIIWTSAVKKYKISHLKEL